MAVVGLARYLQNEIVTALLRPTCSDNLNTITTDGVLLSERLEVQPDGYDPAIGPVVVVEMPDLGMSISAGPATNRYNTSTEVLVLLSNHSDREASDSVALIAAGMRMALNEHSTSASLKIIGGHDNCFTIDGGEPVEYGQDKGFLYTVDFTASQSALVTLEIL